MTKNQVKNGQWEQKANLELELPDLYFKIAMINIFNKRGLKKDIEFHQRTGIY